MYVSGDGDALSIGGNHFLHALRRNVNITILLFNNQVYGLTKGQYSPTASASGQVTGPTPMGSIDWPLNPVTVASARRRPSSPARSTPTARTTQVLHAASRHKGAAFVEILQNCNVYNDGAFDHVRDAKETDRARARRADALRRRGREGRAAGRRRLRRARRDR